MALISVIVPVYKVEPYLRRCIDSILNQTFQDFELILVDDGSPDNCGAICDEYAAKDDQVVVIHQENGGLSAARNAGIDWAFANSDSEWLTFIDSDDWVHPQFLEVLFERVTKDNTYLSMCSSINVANVEAFREYRSYTTTILSPENAYILNTKSVSAYAWGRLYHKETCFRTVRYPIGKAWEDLYTTYKVLFSLSEVSVISEPLYFYFINENGIVRSPWSLKKLDQLDAHEEQIPFFIKRGNYDIVGRLLKSYLNRIKESYVALAESSYPVSVKKSPQPPSGKADASRFKKVRPLFKLVFLRIVLGL